MVDITSDTKEISETMCAVRHTGIVMLVACAVLLVFNSAGLQTWSRNLPGNAVTDQLADQADQWHDVMSQIGVATPKAILQSTVTEMREAEWPGSIGADEAHADDGQD